jgi:hypothetical protein
MLIAGERHPVTAPRHASRPRVAPMTRLAVVVYDAGVQVCRGVGGYGGMVGPLSPGFRPQALSTSSAMWPGGGGRLAPVGWSWRLCCVG